MAGRSINFFISSNAPLFLPFSGFTLFNLPINITPARVQIINNSNVSINYTYSDISSEIHANSNFSIPANFGYNLPAGGSVTLTFSGEMKPDFEALLRILSQFVLHFPIYLH